MVVPNRHMVKYTELTKDELVHIFRMIQGFQLLLDDLYSPRGYNIGMNQGRTAGGSIKHLHVHIVPRFGEELGYIDIVGKTRIVVESLDSVQKKIRSIVDKYLNKEFFENFK